jgi:hypothetical protein
LGKSSSAPDPYATAAAQTQSNQQTANYNADLNRVDQYTPYGSSVYTTTGTSASGAPAYRQDVTLAPLAQQELDNELQQNADLSKLGYGLYAQASNSLAKPVSTDGLPALSGAPTGGAIQSSLGSAGATQGSLDYSKLAALPDANSFGDAAKAASDAAYKSATARLDPQYANYQSDMDAKLANQGVVQGSEAYNRAQDELGRQRTDAYGQAENSAYQQGLAAQQQGYGQALSTRQQGATEATTAGTFLNAAQQQQFDQMSQSGAFANAAQAQAYAQQLSGASANNAARAQGLQEQSTLATMPLNQLQALRSGTQVTNPTFTSVPQSTSANTDISGDIYKSYQLQSANDNSFMNGLFSLGGAALSNAKLMSDRRLKRNIRRVGQTAIMGLPLYAYSYLWEPDRERIGVMADEVRAIAPAAVFRHPSGYLGVDYAMVR